MVVLVPMVDAAKPATATDAWRDAMRHDPLLTQVLTRARASYIPPNRPLGLPSAQPLLTARLSNLCLCV